MGDELSSKNNDNNNVENMRYSTRSNKTNKSTISKKRIIERNSIPAQNNTTNIDNIEENNFSERSSVTNNSILDVNNNISDKNINTESNNNEIDNNDLLQFILQHESFINYYKTTTKLKELSNAYKDFFNTFFDGKSSEVKLLADINNINSNSDLNNYFGGIQKELNDNHSNSTYYDKLSLIMIKLKSFLELNDLNNENNTVKPRSKVNIAQIPLTSNRLSNYKNIKKDFVNSSPMRNICSENNRKKIIINDIITNVNKEDNKDLKEDIDKI